MEKRPAIEEEGVKAKGEGEAIKLDLGRGSAGRVGEENPGWFTVDSLRGFLEEEEPSPVSLVSLTLAR